jgi:predicted RNA polymerase sigma factor
LHPKVSTDADPAVADAVARPQKRRDWYGIQAVAWAFATVSGAHHIDTPGDRHIDVVVAAIVGVAEHWNWTGFQVEVKSAMARMEGTPALEVDRSVAVGSFAGMEALAEVQIQAANSNTVD